VVRNSIAPTEKGGRGGRLTKVTGGVEGETHVRVAERLWFGFGFVSFEGGVVDSVLPGIEIYSRIAQALA